MPNKVYDIKIAESHLSLIGEALGALPYNRVYQLLASLNLQVQRQNAPEAMPEPVREAAE